MIPSEQKQGQAKNGVGFRIIDLTGVSGGSQMTVAMARRAP
jgi:hypothetical protein